MSATLGQGAACRPIPPRLGSHAAMGTPLGPEGMPFRLEGRPEQASGPLEWRVAA